ncbi:MAG: (Fe-S)-binding protein [Bacteroidales bacterium]|nr:(Fe-S)-binding protein [Bacteroidales bacterium]
MTVPFLISQVSSPEIIDRIPGAYDHFVLPFCIGMVFCLCWLGVGLVRVLANLSSSDRKDLLLSFLNPKILWKDIKDIFCDCLLHLKIWQRKPLLGYMHSAIALGWFLLIVLGHLEVWLFAPRHLYLDNGALFYPIFYRYFIWMNPGHTTLRGSLFFFLMDLCLLYVLSGIALAVFKRFRSKLLGMKHTTKPSLMDRVALYSLWGIFPLRLLAESFTADLAGGSFLTLPANALLRYLFGENLYFLPWWWAYSICLGLFFVSLPFTRYMHILTEPLLIVMRNAGIKVRHPRKGFAEAEIYACSSCGLCLDACPMNVQKKNLRFSSVYFIRFLRRHNEKKINRIADKCLQCGKCLALCPVGVDSPAIRRRQRAAGNDPLPFDYSALKSPVPAGGEGKVMYFAGCMSHLTPRIIKAVLEVFRKAGEEFVFADEDGGICCGRPLMLAGKDRAAREVIEANRKMILESGCTTLVLSCPICLKVFREEYNLDGIEILHYTEYMDRLASRGRIIIDRKAVSYVYHDPCELGRGCGIYDAPRRLVEASGELRKAGKEGDESVCCGGSLGSLTLNYEDRGKITAGALENLLANNPDRIVTACPLCLKTFSDATPGVPVVDIAELVAGDTV